MKVTLNRELCTGHAMCNAHSALYELNDDGYNITDELDVPPGREDEALRGAQACPEQALTVS